MAGTYIGMGALAHSYGLSSWWLALSTVLIWAGPAQLIIMAAIGTGGSLVEAAVAVALGGIRLFPMVVALLPLLKSRGTRLRNLLLPMHFTTMSMWVELLRILPGLPRERRIAFCNGLSMGFMGTAVVFGFAGFYLAARLSPFVGGALLFLTPLSFLMSTARNAVSMVDRLALVIGLTLGPLLIYWNVSFDLLWAGVGGGTLAYAFYRFRGGYRRSDLD